MIIDMSSIGTKFENFVQAGCRDLGSHRGRTVYCRKPIILPTLVLFFGPFLGLPVLPFIICDDALVYCKSILLFWTYLVAGMLCLAYYREVSLSQDVVA